MGELTCRKPITITSDNVENMEQVILISLITVQDDRFLKKNKGTGGKCALKNYQAMMFSSLVQTQHTFLKHNVLILKHVTQFGIFIEKEVS